MLVKSLGGKNIHVVHLSDGRVKLSIKKSRKWAILHDICTLDEKNARLLAQKLTNKDLEKMDNA